MDLEPQERGGQDDRVTSADRCELRVSGESWGFAETHAAEIEAHWTRRKAETPHFFNGVIHLMTHHTLDGGVLRAEFVRTDFRSFLYWREQGAPDRSVADAFGSALIRSAEGHVVLGRQRAGNVNGGLAYLPGGFIDARDVAADGTIDIDASIEREIAEETGLAPGAIARVPGYILTFAGPMLSIAAEYRSALTAEHLAAAIGAHIAADANSELAEAVVIKSSDDLKELGMPAYAGVLLGALFPAP